jgi:hypothetical protein
VEFWKIVFGCIAAAVLYGIMHDQVTARICIEYFTVFHPPVFLTQSPTLLAFGWGVFATWWMGAFLGFLLALFARMGSLPKFSMRELFPLVLWLLALMGISALVSGIIGYRMGSVPPDVAAALAPALHKRFLADWWAHGASYVSGFLGGLTLCVIVLVKRIRLGRADDLRGLKPNGQGSLRHG